MSEALAEALRGLTRWHYIDVVEAGPDADFMGMSMQEDGEWIKYDQAIAALAAYDAAPALSDGIAAGMRQAAYVIRERFRLSDEEIADGTFWSSDIPNIIADAILAAIPATGAWEPPPEADRPEGFECLGLNSYGVWRHIRWRSWLGSYDWRTKPDDFLIQPTAFVPLPPAPAGEDRG